MPGNPEDVAPISDGTASFRMTTFYEGVAAKRRRVGLLASGVALAAIAGTVEILDQNVFSNGLEKTMVVIAGLAVSAFATRQVWREFDDAAYYEQRAASYQNQAYELNGYETHPEA